MESEIVKDAEIMHGTPVFLGCLEGGETLEEFLESFPTVSREMAVAALQEGHL